MANPKIEVELTADAKGLKKGAKEAGDAVEKLAKDADNAADKVSKAGDKVDASGKKLSGVGNAAGELAKNRLGPLGDLAEEVGIDFDNMDAKVLAAGAGIAAIGGFAAQGVQKFTALADQVRAVSDASGLSFDTSSRLVAVSDDLGISADTVAASMGRLAKNIDAGKLDEYGIAAVRAKDGSVDMAATLGNVADAMNRTADPARRAAIGTALFGKSWADLQPVLQQGGKGIREAFASVSDGQIVTEENAQAVRDWQMALDDAQDAVSELQMAIGKELIPQLTLMAKDFAKVTGAVGDLSGKQVGLNDIIAQANPFTAIYNARLRDQSDKAAEAAKSMTGLADKVADAGVRAAEAGRASETLARKQDDMATSAKDAAQTLKDLEKALDDATAAQDRAKASVITAFESQNRYEQAQRETAEALATTSTASAALTEATNTYGAESEQAAEAQTTYNQSLQDAEAKVYAQAQAAVDLAQKQADVSGATLDTATANQIYRDKLVEARDATTDPALKQGLSDRITQFDTFSVNANNTATGVAEANTKLAEAKTAVGDSVLHAALDTAASKFGNLASAAWGAADGMAAAAIRAAAMPTSTPMPVSQTSGDPEGLATQRFSAQRSDAAGFETQRSSGQAPNVTFVVNHPIGAPNDFIRWAREELRRAERAQR